MTGIAELLSSNDPDTLQNIVLELSRRVEELERKFVEVDSLAELTTDMGPQTAGEFVASDDQDHVDPEASDFSGLFMAALAKTIADGNVARFAEVLNGVAQFWIANGAAYFSRGQGIMNEDGIQLSGHNDALVLQSTDGTVLGLLGIDGYGWMELRRLKLSSLVNEIENGDFESGDFTNWTETDVAGKISVSSEDKYAGTYSAKFASGCPAASRITQAVTSGLNLITFRAKAVGGSQVMVLRDATGGVKSFKVGEDWAKFYLVYDLSTIGFEPPTTTSYDVYIDNVVVQPLSDSEVIGFDNLGVDLPDITTGDITAEDIDADSVDADTASLNNVTIEGLVTNIPLAQKALAGHSFTVGNDGVHAVTAPSTYGWMLIMFQTPSTTSYAVLMYNSGAGSENITSIHIGTNFLVDTSLPRNLTGSTGTAGKFNIGLYNGQILLENRLGTSRTGKYIFIG